METISLELLHAAVDRKCELGEQNVGCQASPYDRAYYAAQVLFPQADDSAHHRMAEFVQELLP